MQILGAFELLATLQNQFLEEALTLAANGCKSLQYLEKQPNISGTKSVALQAIRSGDIIQFQWNPEILNKYGQCSVDYGHGKEIFYDFEKIEFELAAMLVTGKAYIN